MAATSSEPGDLLRFEQGAIRLDLKLTPKAKQTAVTGRAVDADGKAYVKASVTAIPEHGKANAAPGSGLINLIQFCLARRVQMPGKKRQDMPKHIRAFLTLHMGPHGQTRRAGLFLRRYVVVNGL